MNFGYFCNTTNWNKKPYTQLLEEAREIAIYCDQNNWNSIWFTEHHFNHEGKESCTNPLTSENLIKMSEKITEVTKDILPDENIDCVAYGCTSGTIAAGYSSIEEKIKKAKPSTSVTTPSTAAVSALKKLNIKKIYLFTPYPKKLNDDVIEFFKKEGFEITSNSYFDIASDIDIGKVDPEYLYEVLSNIDLNDADALFISCTALPALAIIDRLEKKHGKMVLSSNQALIWETLEKIGMNKSITGFGKLFSN